jgi:pimeloyl-ACP methyl ester carboxylesterase
MLRRRLITLGMLCAVALASTTWAQGTLLKVPTREGVKTTLFWEAAPDARATVLLFPGGGGGFGKVEDGRATGGNFLVRSTPYFLSNGFNVAIFGRPSDMDELGWTERTEAPHMTDAAKVLEFIKQKSPLPVWIVGTSRGTVSATAMAIQVRDPAIAGLVLTSSVVRHATPGAVSRQDLNAIQIPVLIYHHAKDACKHCVPSETSGILKGLTHAPIKKLMLVDGGANPSGDVCAGQHWHGFIGMEKEAVDQITHWMSDPHH